MKSSSPRREGGRRRGRWRRYALAAALLVVVAVAARGPMLRWVGRQLVHEDPLVAADAVVVLAGDTPAREIAAADLLRDGWAPRVLLTVEPPRIAIERLRRRGVRVPTELEERRRFLEELGVPPAAITVLPGVIDSTWAEAMAVQEWLRRENQRRLIVVTSRYHTARARFIFQRTLGDSSARLTFRAADDEFRPDTWWQTRATLRDGFFEWQKLIFYRLRYCCS